MSRSCYVLFLLAVLVPGIGLAQYQVQPVDAEAWNEGLEIGPVAGLTTVWHRSPVATAVPLGATLEFRVEARGSIRWTGARVVESTRRGSVARYRAAEVGRHEVAVEYLGVDGEWIEERSVLNVVDTSLFPIRISEIRVRAEPVEIDEDNVNASTMSYYFRDESIARLKEVGENRYRTSSNRWLALDAAVDPPGFAPLIEWRYDGAPIDQLGAIHVRVFPPRVHELTAGFPDRPRRLDLETYTVVITREDAEIPDQAPVTFTARTLPAGYEQEITWMASTKYGSCSPLTGRGPEFTVWFDDTVGPDGHRWLGVRADNAFHGEDRNEEVVEAGPDPQIEITGPADRTLFCLGETVHLSATLGDALAPIEWEVDQLGISGDGGDFAFVPPSTGAYLIIARAGDAEDSIVIVVSLDSDGDGVCDRDDNCAEVANAAQADADGDELGDACDPDVALFCSEDSQVVAVDADGLYRIPDWSAPDVVTPFIVDPSRFDAPPRIEQSPAPGTEIAAAATVAVQVTVTDDVRTESCVVELEVVDATPPQVSVLGIASGDEVALGDEVAAQVSAVDETDPSPVVEATLDGEAYAPGTPITEPGIHVLRASATDAAGNRGEAAPVTFQILARPRLDARAVVEKLSCSTDDGGFARMDATVLLAAAGFDVRSLQLYTIYLWPQNEGKLPLSRGPVRIADSVDPITGGYDYTTADAMFQNGFWRLRFSTRPEDETLIGCPARLLLTGGGNRGTSTSFDFEAETLALVDKSPIGTLIEEELLTPDPKLPPPPEPKWPPCEWKERLELGETDLTNPADRSSPNRCFGGVQREGINLFAKGGRFGGSGFAIDECSPGNGVISRSVTSHATYQVFLEGAESCCGCKITCILRPKFKGRATVNPPGKALAAGLIDVKSTCDVSARAAGGAQEGDETPTKIKFKAGASVDKDGPAINAGIEVETTIVSAGQNEVSFVDNQIGMVNRCNVLFSVVSTGKIDVMADAHLFNWYARADASLVDASPGIEVRAKCESPMGDCPADEKVFKYE